MKLLFEGGFDCDETVFDVFWAVIIVIILDYMKARLFKNGFLCILTKKLHFDDDK